MNGSFRNCESMQVMHSLDKLILSNKMVVAAKQDVPWWIETSFDFI